MVKELRVCVCVYIGMRCRKDRMSKEGRVDRRVTGVDDIEKKCTRIGVRKTGEEGQSIRGVTRVDGIVGLHEEWRNTYTKEDQDRAAG